MTAGLTDAAFAQKKKTNNFNFDSGVVININNSRTWKIINTGATRAIDAFPILHVFIQCVLFLFYTAASHLDGTL